MSLKVLTVLFLLWVFVTATGSVAILLFPGFHGTRPYNLLIGALLLVFAAAARRFPCRIRSFTRLSKQSAPYAIALEAFIICFFSILLPLLGVSDLRKYCIIILATMTLALVVACMFRYILKLEHQHAATLRQREQEKAQAGWLNERCREMIALKHYYADRFYSMAKPIREKDPALEQYFERYIGEIHSAHFASDIGKIENDLLRNLIDLYVDTLRSKGAAVQLEIHDEICIPDGLIEPVSEILSIFLSNAARSCATQQYGACQFLFSASEVGCTITIRNSVHGKVNVKKLFETEWEPKDKHGYGLRRVEQLVSEHSGITINTICTEHFFTQTICIQGELDV